MGKLHTYLRLGLGNLARVALYRGGLASGLHPVLRVQGIPAQPPFFTDPARREGEQLARPLRWLETRLVFDAHLLPLEDPPAWNADPFFPDKTATELRPWQEIPDFGAGRDVKSIWEASRFDWVVSMAQRASLGETGELERLNRWLADWAESVPSYLGPNWKCGQEASLRVLHLAAAALVMRSERSALPGLLDLVELHCRRIAPTMSYARAQDNNHGTSEAAALFVGGSWLQACGRPAGAPWSRIGRAALEERGERLIGDDGSFSQYSVTYHRLMLDTFSLTEIWRRRLSLQPFSARLQRRLASASHWLRQFTDEATGDAPNIGANDGAYLIPLTDAGYRDFRPSVQLASALFAGCRAYREPGSWDMVAAWLDCETASHACPPLRSQTMDQGGFHVLRSKEAAAYLRYPRFRFRPAQADALHLDVWLRGRNILRDGGTFSYAVSDADHRYFSGTRAHNTVEFDSRDQMPRLGRFLFGDWLEASQLQAVEQLGPDTVRAAAGYRDGLGATHKRTVELSPDRLTCVDELAGAAKNATLRWRMIDGEYRIDGNRVVGSDFSIAVTCDRECRVTLARGEESRFYLKKSALPVVEVTCPVPATIESRIVFA